MEFALLPLDGARGLNLQEAIDAPGFHSVHFPSSFYPRTPGPASMLVEDRLGADGSPSFVGADTRWTYKVRGRWVG